MPARDLPRSPQRARRRQAGQWSERRSGRKAEPVRARGAVAHARDRGGAEKAAASVPATGGEPPVEPRKPQRAGAATGPRRPPRR